MRKTSYIQKAPHKPLADFSEETLQTRREWQYIQSTNRKKKKTNNHKYSTWQGYPSERRRKHFTDKQKLKEFFATKLALQKM